MNDAVWNALFQNIPPGARVATCMYGTQTGPVTVSVAENWQGSPSQPSRPLQPEQPAPFDFDVFKRTFEATFLQPQDLYAQGQYVHGQYGGTSPAPAPVPQAQAYAPQDARPSAPADAASGSEPTASGAVPNGAGPGSGSAHARLSFASAEAASRLKSSDVKVAALAHAVSAVEAEWRSGQLEAAAAKSRLAELEAIMKQVESKEVDDVQTGDLQSGKEQVRGMKKDQLRRLEELFARVEDLFKELRR